MARLRAASLAIAFAAFAAPGCLPPRAARRRKIDARFRPFYSIGEVVTYRLYHDLDEFPIPVW